MAPDPVLRDYLNESLTDSEHRDIAHLWQKYTEKKHPSIRDLDSVTAGHDLNINAKPAQLSFLLSRILVVYFASLEWAPGR